MERDERAQAEEAFAALSAPRSVSEPQWPPAARRIREARERVGLPESVVADKLGMTPTEYQDVEFHDDEVFINFSIKHLRALAEVLGLPLHQMLLGPDAEAAAAPITTGEIARRISALAASRKVSLEELSDSVGWDLEPIINDPGSLAELNLDGLHEICAAIGVDWVSAL